MFTPSTHRITTTTGGKNTTHGIQKKVKTTLPTVCMITESLVPVCEYCHSKRVYEFQLMPNILSHYNRVQTQTQSQTPTQVQVQQPPVTVPTVPLVSNSTNTDTQGVGGGGLGLEFGVVAIYVCPNSCSVEGVCRECVVVQSCADMIR